MKANSNKNHLIVSAFTIIIIFSLNTISIAYENVQDQNKITPLQISLATPFQIFDENYAVTGIRLNLCLGTNKDIFGIDAGMMNFIKSEMTGLQIGLVNKDRRLYGFQVAGLINIVDDRMCGFQGSVLINWAIIAYGVQAAGLLNLSLGGEGIAIAGFGNLSGEFNGIQLAGIYNAIDPFVPVFGGGNSHYTRDSNGIQIAGIGNQAYDNFYGLQLAGIFNWNEMEFAGVQAGILYNRVGKIICGTQIGLINSADRVKGVQIGLINYARRMSGVQIGLVNIIEEGALPVFPIFNASMSF